MKDKLKFMHSLIGSFVIDTLKSDIEMVEGKPHRKLEIKISEFFKRIFYLPCQGDSSSIVENDIKIDNLSAAFPIDGESFPSDNAYKVLSTWIKKLREA